jgi:hypothetical protein
LGAESNFCFWPIAPICKHRTDDRYRGEADGRFRRAYDREGSPAAVQAIGKKLNGARRMPDSKGWFNAMTASVAIS